MQDGRTSRVESHQAIRVAGPERGKQRVDNNGRRAVDFVADTG